MRVHVCGGVCVHVCVGYVCTCVCVGGGYVCTCVWGGIRVWGDIRLCVCVGVWVCGCGGGVVWNEQGMFAPPCVHLL